MSPPSSTPRTARSAAEQIRGEDGAAHPVAASVGSTEAARELVTAAVGTLRPEGTIPVTKLSTLDELHTCGGAELGTSSWM